MANTMANDRCADCGAVYALVGLRHRCVARTVEAVSERVPSRIDGEGSTYRYRDAERRRVYMRDYMKRRRARVT